MNPVFANTIFRLINEQLDHYCVFQLNNKLLVFTDPLEIYQDLNEIGPENLVVGFQHHDGENGHWVKFKNIETINLLESNVYNLTVKNNVDTNDPIEWENAIEEKDFIETVRNMQNEMFEGKYYLANLTRDISLNHNLDPQYIAFLSSLYHDCENPFFYYSKDISLLGLSPEKFVSISNGYIETFPMKGTASKGSALVDNEKEYIENTMMIDLVRSDLSKICEPESIELISRGNLSRHPGLVQMSSALKGKLDKKYSLVEQIKKMMPIASVTGTPKPYVVNRIKTLENSSRGIYCGAYGVIDTANNICDLNVAIRTIEFEDNKCKIGVGSGITLDSDPQSEWDETILKAFKFKDLCNRSVVKDSSGIFTSIALNKDGSLFAPKNHIERLVSNAQKLSIEIDNNLLISQIKDFLVTTPSDDNNYLRVSIDHINEIKIEYGPMPKAKSNIILGIAYSPDFSLETRQVKGLNRNVYNNVLVDAQNMTQTHIDDAIIIVGSRILETTRANIFFVKDNIIYTPKSDDFLLQGVAWKTIKNDLEDKYDFIEKDISTSELKSFDTVICVNSVRGPQIVEYITNDIFGINIKYQNIKSKFYDDVFKVFSKNFEPLNG